MKKYVCLLTVLMLITGFVGCASHTGDPTLQDAIRIFQAAGYEVVDVPGRGVVETLGMRDFTILSKYPVIFSIIEFVDSEAVDTFYRFLGATEDELPRNSLLVMIPESGADGELQLLDEAAIDIFNRISR